ADIRYLLEERVDDNAFALLLLFADQERFRHDLNQVFIAPEYEIAYVSLQQSLLSVLSKRKCGLKIHHALGRLLKTHSLGGARDAIHGWSADLCPIFSCGSALQFKDEVLDRACVVGCNVSEKCFNCALILSHDLWSHSVTFGQGFLCQKRCEGVVQIRVEIRSEQRQIISAGTKFCWHFWRVIDFGR